MKIEILSKSPQTHQLHQRKSQSSSRRARTRHEDSRQATRL